MTAKSQRKTSDEPLKGLEIKLIPEVTENTSYYYCNYASVTHSKYDFVLTFARVPTFLKPEQEELARAGKKIPVEAALQVAVSPQLIEGLVNALLDQKKKYDAQFSKKTEGG